MSFVNLVIHGLSAISVNADVVGVRALIASSTLILFTLIGMAAVVAIRLFTDTAIPGWATSAAGLLFVLLMQLVVLSIAFSFITLSNRHGTTVLPLRDYPYFISSCRLVYASPRPAAEEVDGGMPQEPLAADSRAAPEFGGTIAMFPPTKGGAFDVTAHVP